MGTITGITWTQHTFNPHIGCLKISPECKNCYAAVDAPARIARSKGVELWGPPESSTRQITSDANWKLPMRWAGAARKRMERERVFCASQADVFEDFPGLDAMRARLWQLIEATRDYLDWQLLTKRPGNIKRMVPQKWLEEPPRGVWYGTTVGTQESADKRMSELLEVPAQVRFLSCEPLLEPITFDIDRMTPRFSHCPDDTGTDQEDSGCAGCLGNPLAYANGGDHCGAQWSGIHWVIVGGESGPQARPFDLTWARSIIAQCRTASVPVFVKQLGAYPLDGERMSLNDRSGGDMAEWPEDLRIREFPSCVVSA